MIFVFVSWGCLLFMAFSFELLAFFEKDKLSKHSLSIQGTICLVASIVIGVVYYLKGDINV
jgi:hypothetical protein